MQSGRSVSPCTSGTTCAISPTSSAIGSPTLTSSTSALPTCSATSISTCERSPACSCAWNALRPVGLMRSPMIVKGPSALMTTFLDRDSRTVSTRLPFRSCGYAETPAETGDGRLAAKADQVQTADTWKRACVLRELVRDLEALRLRVVRLLAARDHLRRNLDAGHLLIDEPERRRARARDRSRAGSPPSRRRPAPPPRS